MEDMIHWFCHRLKETNKERQVINLDMTGLPEWSLYMLTSHKYDRNNSLNVCRLIEASRNIGMHV